MALPISLQISSQRDILNLGIDYIYRAIVFFFEKMFEKLQKRMGNGQWAMGNGQWVILDSQFPALLFPIPYCL
jgi:hypothetical protein